MDIDFAPAVSKESCTSWPMIDIDVPAVNIRFTISRADGSITAD
jgi:hypothetical protein